MGGCWNKYHDDFYDVILACNEKHIKVHKAIIIICSSILANLLRKHLTETSCIFIRDLGFEDSQNLNPSSHRNYIGFSYKGGMK